LEEHLETITLWNESIENKIRKEENVSIYGAGEWGCAVLRYCKDKKIKVNQIIVTDKNNNLSKIYDIPVIGINDIVNKSVLIIVCINGDAGENIANQLVLKGFTNILLVKRIPKGYVGYEYYQRIPEQQYGDEIKILYWNNLHKELNLTNPISFNEKIQYIKIYSSYEEMKLMTMLVDKVAVREWVKTIIGEKHLVPILGIWKSYDEIDFDKLPNKFVMKCNHGCGYNYVVQNKEQIDIEDIRKKLNSWMNENFAYQTFEMQYKDIKPLIYAEQYLENVRGDLFDYKFWCFNGKVKYIMFLSNRASELRMNFYDRQWKLQKFTYNYRNTEEIIRKPDCLDEMIDIAERLAIGFSHVRVDLYLVKNKIYFGEMTFTSCSGFCNWTDDNIDQLMGSFM